MTASGLVSRVSPVQTVLGNCTRDEGGPFEVGNQVLISSHRKLLSSERWPIACAMQHGVLLWVMYGRRPRCKGKESDLFAKRSGAVMYPACFRLEDCLLRDAAAMAAGPDVIR
jgi:hypothetical protein